MLLAERSKTVQHGGTWAGCGGAVETGETPGRLPGASWPFAVRVPLGPQSRLPEARPLDRWETSRVRWVAPGDVGRYKLHPAMPLAWHALSPVITKESSSAMNCPASSTISISQRPRAAVAGSRTSGSVMVMRAACARSGDRGESLLILVLPLPG
ncbi:MAG: hypothetical protein ACRDPO_30525 [Streptosporangiaceae bacterium]